MPDFRFLIDDLGRVSDEELRVAREAPAFARLVWFLFKRARTSRDLLRELEPWAGLIRELGSDPAAQDDFLAFIVYARVVATIPRARLRAFLEAHLPDLESTMSRTLSAAEQIARGAAWEHRQKWMAEGRLEGRVEGEARLLLKQITQRFGTPSGEIVARIAAASTDELDAWGLRLLAAASIDEVFA